MMITGLTKRTLHYYDQTGLLPARKLSNGYRIYSQQDLIDLQRILFLKALGFSIKDIQPLLKLSDTDLRPFLEERQLGLTQKILELQERQKQLKDFLAGTPLLDLEMFETPLVDQYQAEAECRYGATSAYQTYKQRQAQLDSSQKTTHNQTIEDRFDKVFQDFLTVSHLPLTAKEVAEAVENWKTALLTVSDFSDDVLRSIAKSYTCDPRFKSYFIKYGDPHLTDFMVEAISHYLK
ncbi:MerR family transcriptional regulator [Streptococcus rifensis]